MTVWPVLFLCKWSVCTVSHAPVVWKISNLTFDVMRVVYVYTGMCMSVQVCLFLYRYIYVCTGMSMSVQVCLCLYRYVYVCTGMRTLAVLWWSLMPWRTGQLSMYSASSFLRVFMKRAWNTGLSSRDVSSSRTKPSSPSCARYSTWVKTAPTCGMERDLGT